MPGSGGVYAVKTRRKPVQKIVKPPPTKTNPSKRHRDRLNVELDHLTSLLPFSDEVRGRLDKLSVLRLSVGYLKVKSYFHAMLQRTPAPPVSANIRNGQSMSVDGVSLSEGDLLLQALNGFVLVVATDGTVFYTSPTIHDLLGFHQSDVVQQSIYDLIHMDDRETFRCQLHFALNPNGTNSHRSPEDGQPASRASCSLLPQHIPPENSSFLERNFCCRLRCLQDNTSGFLALNFSGRLKYLHLQGNTGADGTAPPPPLALFAIATPLQPPAVMEIRTKTLIFQTKHSMDFAPLGVDTRGKLVLGYSEVELVTTRSGYQFIHAADMMYCADNHLKMIKTGDSGFTFFRLLTKTGHWLWVQATARVVFKGGKPDFIIARQKALTNEEGEEHLRQRRQQLPFNLATGEGVLYNTLDDFSIPAPPGPPDVPGSSEPATEKPLDPASILGSLRRQDQSLYTQPQTPSPLLPLFSQMEDLEVEQPPSTLEQAFLDSRALLSVPGQTQASQRRSLTGDVTSDAMIDSLEQILEDIGAGGVEGLEVEQTELRDWETTLVRMSNEREDTSDELNRILANDVFSYVEEALRRETGGLVQDSEAQVYGDRLYIEGQDRSCVFSNNKQPVMDTTFGLAEQTLLGDFCDFGHSSRPKAASPGAAHTQRLGAQQGHVSSLWSPGSSDEMTSVQQSWPPSFQNIHGSHHSASQVSDQAVRYNLNSSDSQLRGLSVWSQPPGYHQHTPTHSSHTLNWTAPSCHPETQRISGSYVCENQEGRAPNAAAVPARLNWPVHAAGTTSNAAFTLSHPDVAAGNLDQGTVTQSSGPDVGLVHLSGDSTGLETVRSDYPTENGSLQSAFFCWNGDVQMPRPPLNNSGPFAFPPGTFRLSQNSGP